MDIRNFFAEKSKKAKILVEVEAKLKSVEDDKEEEKGTESSNLSYQGKLDLNQVKLDVAKGFPESDIRKRPQNAEFKDIKVIFNNQEEELCQLIRDHKGCVAVGCVAWFTSGKILDTLIANKMRVQFVVHKESWLLPDGEREYWKERLHQQYSKLRPREATRFDEKLRVNYNADGTMEPIRCCGAGTSRMHHKFIVFCEPDLRINDNEMEYTCPGEAICVWTGSFNFTETASRSLENSVIIKDREVAQHYKKEWLHVFSLSEPLLRENASSCDPEFYYGE
jgi:hypothetical protein